MPNAFIGRVCVMVLMWVGISVHADTTSLAVDKWTDGLMLYASFDDPQKADLAIGTADVVGEPYRIGPGKVGNAFFCNMIPARFYSQGNFNIFRGTVAFWFRSDLNWLADNVNRDFFKIVNSNFLFQHQSKKNIVFFMTGTDRSPEGFAWDYGSTLPVSFLPPGEWTHVTLTWNATENIKSIYVNGKHVKTRKTPWMRPEGSSNGHGIDIGNQMVGQFDELVIYDRVLSDEEIVNLAQKPDQIAQVMKQSRIHRDEPWPLYPDLYYWPNLSSALFVPGQSVQINVSLSNRTHQMQKALIEATLLDLWDKPVGEPKTQELELAGGSKTTWPLEYRTDRYGFYKVRIAVGQGHSSRFRDIAAFACIPSGNPPIDPFFGIHVNPAGDMPEACKRLGFSSNRVHDMSQFTWWVRMQPTKEEWAMDGASAYSKYLSLGYRVFGEWFGAPNWAVVKPDGTSPAPEKGYPKGWVPTNMEALRAYVRESIRRFPEINEWDIWNEPSVSMFWHGTPEKYVEMARVIYDEAKRANSNLILYAQAHDLTQPWGRKMLAGGIMEACDGISFHHYIGPQTTPLEARTRVIEIREMMGKNTGKNVSDIPLVNSEVGLAKSHSLYGLDFPGCPPVSKQPELQHRQGAIAYVRSWIIWKAMGLRGIYYYLANPTSNAAKYNPDSDYNIIEPNLSPRPFVIAQCILAWQLDTGRFVAEVHRMSEGFYAAVFSRQDGQSVAVMWSEDDAELKAGVAAGKAYDMMGNLISATELTIAQEPIYLQSNQSGSAMVEYLKTLSLATIKPANIRQGEIPLQADLPSIVFDSDYPLSNELGLSRLHPVDMSAVANSSLAHDGTDGSQGGVLYEGPFNDLRMLNPGRHVWLGVPFQLDGNKNTDRSVLTLYGMTCPTGPKEATVRIDRSKVRAIFFANLANWAITRGVRIAEYVVNYSDGQQEILPVVIGENIFNWWSGHQENEYGRTVGFLHPEPSDPKSPYRYVRIWCWENRRPDQTIDSITLRSTSVGSTVSVLGITVGTW